MNALTLEELEQIFSELFYPKSFEMAGTVLLCIKKDGWSLTEGHIYVSQGTHLSKYTVFNDGGVLYHYPASLFKILIEP